MGTNYLESVIKQFEYYKLLGEKTFSQVPDEKLFYQHNEECNSIATIVKHLWGNMLSRWTDFLTADGEKEWRNRDAEFENDISTRDELLAKWNEGWKVFLSALYSLRDEDLVKTVYIRNQGHTVMEAINRQLAHYPYHVGQIVYLGKVLAQKWQSLSIPRGQSQQYNAVKFSEPKRKVHFTDEFLNDKTRMNDVGHKLRSAHERLWAECASIAPEKQFSSINGKWSALQHVQHITKGAGAFYKYLQSGKSMIAANHGTTDKGSRSFEEVYAAYERRLAEGAVSTPPFNPGNSELISLEEERQKGRHIIEGIIATVSNWTEDDLDKYLCPHPTLGKMTAREMLYFTIIHAEHHAMSIRKLHQVI